MRTVAAVLALIMCVHAGLWVLLRSQTKAPEFNGHLASLSYTPFSSSDHPDRGARPTAEQIRADLKAIAPYTRAIRLYSSAARFTWSSVGMLPPFPSPREAVSMCVMPTCLAHSMLFSWLFRSSRMVKWELSAFMP